MEITGVTRNAIGLRLPKKQKFRLFSHLHDRLLEKRQNACEQGWRDRRFYGIIFPFGKKGGDTMYYIADVLTASRIVVAAVIFNFAFRGETASSALMVAAIAELTDAFDGAVARQWPYPRDGKRRWWRVYAEEIDQIADLTLALAVLYYIGAVISLGFALFVLTACVLVGVPVQIWRAWRIRKIPNEDADPLRVRVILARRWLYLAAMATVFVRLAWAATGESLELMAILIALGAVVALGLFALKSDRLRRDKPHRPARR